MSTFSCGCSWPANIDGISVYILGEDCDATNGYHPSSVYHYTCPDCAKKWVDEGWATLDQQEAEVAFEEACNEYERLRNAG